MLLLTSNNMIEQITKKKYKGVKTLIAGDSHTKTAIDHNLINNCINISDDAENYLYTYFKIKYLLKNGIKINTVILSLSYNNLSNNYDIYLTSSFAKEKFTKYYSTLGIKNIYEIIKINPQLLAQIPHAIKKKTAIGIKALISNDINKTPLPQFGGFYNSKKSNLDNNLITKRIKSQFYDGSNTDVRGFSINQLYYLDKIISICKKNNLKLIFMTPPLHEEFISKIPTNYLYEYNRLINKITSDGYECLQYQNLKLPKNYYGDGDHLNYYGAQYITKKITNYLEK